MLNWGKLMYIAMWWRFCWSLALYTCKLFFVCIVYSQDMPNGVYVLLYRSCFKNSFMVLHVICVLFAACILTRFHVKDCSFPNMRLLRTPIWVILKKKYEKDFFPLMWCFRCWLYCLMHWLESESKWRWWGSFLSGFLHVNRIALTELLAGEWLARNW